MIDYETFEEKFIYYFSVYGIDFDARIIKDFYIFTNYLLSENKKYNLTAIKNIDEIIVKHYIDSVIVLKYFEIPENAKIIDIGTGAGLPGLPLLIMRKDLRITFLDSSHKKINFIKNTAGLINTQANFYNGRAEDYGRKPDVRETYDFAVSRAVAKLSVLCEFAAPLIKPGGVFIAYKSRNIDEEIFGAERAFRMLDLAVTGIADFDLNVVCMGGVSPPANQRENNKRVLVKIKKFSETSPKYPRKFSDITKKPL